MRILVIINLNAGGSVAGLYDFIRLVGEHGGEIVLRYANASTRIEDLLSDADHFNRIVAAGGDGTASSICYALRDTGIPLLLYPSGTANLLVSNLALPLNAPALVDILFEDTPVTFDIGEIDYCDDDRCLDKRGFAIMAGAGYDATIMQSAQPMKSNFGTAAYFVGAIANLAPEMATFDLVLDGERIQTDGIMVLLVNFGRIQFDLPLIQADPQDGRFDVVVVRSKNVIGLLPAVAAAVMRDRDGGNPERGHNVDLYSASTVEISARPPLGTQYDGEVAEETTPLRARVLPRAANLFVGRDSLYSKSD